MTEENKNTAVSDTGSAVYYSIIRKRYVLIVTLIGLCMVSWVIDVMTGPAVIGIGDVIKSVFKPQQVDGSIRVIVRSMRIPIALMALAVGSSLGLAGAVMQTILCNPLASPYTLGVGAGASFGASLAVVTGVSVLPVVGEYMVSINAFFFAMMVCLLIYFLGKIRGMSTLLKCMMGILRAEGNVILGTECRRNLAVKWTGDKVSYLTQENAVPALLTVFEVVLLGRMTSLSLKIPEEELEKVYQVLKKVKMEQLASRMFRQLSGGQRRVVSIAQAIVKEPDILIMDEPTANLDMQNQLEVLELVRTYTKERKVATLVTLHDLNMAARYADRIIILKDGKVFCQGSPAETLTEEVVRQTYKVEAEITYDRNGIPIVNPLYVVS